VHHFEAQSRLADPAFTNQGDQPLRRHQIHHVSELGLAANQLGNRLAKVCQRADWSGGRQGRSRNHRLTVLRHIVAAARVNQDLGDRAEAPQVDAVERDGDHAGGPDNDCLQGGGGADVLSGEGGKDVLIAGAQRPALDTGPGGGRIVVCPASTQCTTSTTSGVSFNVGGSAGWNFMQIANATVAGGISISNAQTITCPSIIITNEGNPTTGQTDWHYDFPDGLVSKDLLTFYNQWIWEVPFSQYSAGQKTVVVGSEGHSEFDTGEENFSCGFQGYCPITTLLNSTVPLPSGDTFALQKPAVLSVSPTCANAGSTFTINGTGFYPSLVTSVLIGGRQLNPSQFTTTSDTAISVTAPEEPGEFLPVVVQTEEGLSNANVTIEISVIDLCSSARSKRPRY